MKEFIEQLIKEQAAVDKDFAALLNKENKSIDECYKYVIGEAYKKAEDNKQGNCGVWCGISNDPIISLIVHYYQEDDVKPTPLPKNVGCTTTPQKPKETKKKSNEKKSKETKSNVVQLELF